MFVVTTCSLFLRRGDRRSTRTDERRWFSCRRQIHRRPPERTSEHTDTLAPRPEPLGSLPRRGAVPRADCPTRGRVRAPESEPVCSVGRVDGALGVSGSPTGYLVYYLAK